MTHTEKLDTIALEILQIGASRFKIRTKVDYLASVQR